MCLAARLVRSLAFAPNTSPSADAAGRFKLLYYRSHYSSFSYPFLMAFRHTRPCESDKAQIFYEALNFIAGLGKTKLNINSVPTIFALCKLKSSKNGHFEAFPRPIIQNPHFRGQKKYSQVFFAQYGAITRNVNSLCKPMLPANSLHQPEHEGLLNSRSA